MRLFLKLILYILFYFISINQSVSQSLTAYVSYGNKPLSEVKLNISGTRDTSLYTDAQGKAFLKPDTGRYHVVLQSDIYAAASIFVHIQKDSLYTIHIQADVISEYVGATVKTGTMRSVNRLRSPVLVELYSPAFFKRNPTSNIFEALQNINGIRPQVNCNVCNTGDIHINGLEGPYTMVLIDGMPIVSSLSTVYGLFGIPNSIISRVEVVRGPSSSLYGSEAVGGLINIITKSPANSPKFSIDFMANSWGELNTDIAIRKRLSKNIDVLTGINYFNYSIPMDKNKDGFTDIALQNRISIFQKWKFERKTIEKAFNLAGRYLYEDRWGGQMQWNRSFRGGDSVYGESIFTSRSELLGEYDLPGKLPLKLSFSFNRHHQNSVYGTTIFNAVQAIGFGQLVLDKQIGNHALLAGLTYRKTYYDDNTVATQYSDSLFTENRAQNIDLPGIFIQDEIELKNKQSVLLGMRYDYHNVHGPILSPRIAYIKNFDLSSSVRLNIGKGFRVVNLFTEDHAALTGARTLVIKNNLNPENSYNASISLMHKISGKNRNLLTIELNNFYTYFDNRIIADYSDPNKIQYDNLSGYSVSRGSNLNLEYTYGKNWLATLGFTLMDVFIVNNQVKSRPMLTERFSSTWSLTHKLNKYLSFDYTGNLYSPMLLPTLGALDPRPNQSPWWSIQNLKINYEKNQNTKLFFGVKNLLNWTPWKNAPFLIARPHDPFDKQVQYDSNGQIVSNAQNPYALSFDPSYVFAPNQGRRIFAGINYTF